MASGKTDHALERLVFFSDAVFAIAITLLVIELHPPHFEHGASDADQLRALIPLIPNLFGFAISFAVIGAFWSGHHRAFTLAGRYDGSVLIWNLALLGAIAFVPFVTAFMSVNDAMRVPATIYWGWIVLTALLNLKVNSIATGPLMRGEDVGEEAARAIPRRSRGVLMGALSALALSFVVPRAGAVAMATIPFWIWLQRRTARRPAA
jgi:uncharacterized membrane protein